MCNLDSEFYFDSNIIIFTIHYLDFLIKNGHFWLTSSFYIPTKSAKNIFVIRKRALFDEISYVYDENSRFLSKITFLLVED